VTIQSDDLGAGKGVKLSLVLTDGVLALPCSRCDEIIEVRISVVDAGGPRTRAFNKTYESPTQFIAEASTLHARLWGHMVRKHQPDPHPYRGKAYFDKPD
jgi:hypothetical protein